MKKLLIVAHAPSPNTRALLAAVRRGAQDPAITSMEIRVRSPFEAGPQDILAADGLILGITENLAYMAGAVKDFFDRIYYPTISEKQGMPYALYIRAGSDGTGAMKGVERIVTGLRWRSVQKPLVLRGSYDKAFELDCEKLGLAFAAGLEAGVF
ncbi:MAG: flavodoxin family protein [Rhodospirillales bacterium]